MNRVVEGSCTLLAKKLRLSPLATLALRVSLMILRRITWRDEDLCLKVDISSSKVAMRVSRRRRSVSLPASVPSCTDGPISGYTETTPSLTAVQAQVALLSGGKPGAEFENSAEGMAAIPF